MAENSLDDGSRRDLDLVDVEFSEARATGRPIDSAFIEDLAEKRFEQAQRYRENSDPTPGSSWRIVNELVALSLLAEQADERFMAQVAPQG